MWKDFPDLEIRIDKRADSDEDSSFAVEYRLSLPGNDTVSSSKNPITTTFDFEALRQEETSPKSYGSVLARAFFTPDLRVALAKGVAVSEEKNLPLRLRLHIGTTAKVLNTLLWETLCNPEDDTFIATNERILFSRYLNSSDMRPVGLPSKSNLRALVVVANPSDLNQYSLDSIDIEGEISRARQALERIEMKVLASGGTASFETILRELREGYDVLYLACHGQFSREETGDGVIEYDPWIWLESKSGTTKRVSGRDFASSLKQLRECPRLVVMASCESAGTGTGSMGSQDSNVLAALGPLLAAEGVPAVIAMQGRVTMETMGCFMPAVFKELSRRGEIDKAVAVGRKAVSERPDWWMPVLYSRLKSGRLWYDPGFSGDGINGSFVKWPSVTQNIEADRLTPILGAGLSEHILGSRQEIARQWAEGYEFPMSPHEQDDFPRMAQYLAVTQQAQFPIDKYIVSLGKAIRARVPKDQQEDLAKLSLDELVDKVGQQVRGSLSSDPYKVLAQLPLSIYITTDPTDLLADALREAKKKPVEEFCRWNKATERLPSSLRKKGGAAYQPTPEEPLVFQLFGRVTEPSSLVITEDDYFDYLSGVTRNKDLIPAVVRAKLVDSGLLFLGFQMEDWNFRVLLRSILSLEGSERRQRYAHVAAQIDPNRILDPDGARRYLEAYFQGNSRISIYWGSLEAFIEELRRHWKERSEAPRE